MRKRGNRSIELFIMDIFIAIGKIQHYTDGFTDGSALCHNILHWDATIRQLEIIGEALNNLLLDERFELSAPKYFRKVVNFRNMIAHGYFGIDENEVWSVVKFKLEDLKNDLLALTKTLSIDLSEALEFVTSETEFHNDKITSEYLIKIFNI